MPLTVPEPSVLFCVGATKAGTSWLYRYLHDHPDCSLPAVKEAHYWDTFDADVRDRQLTAFGQRLQELHDLRAEAEAAGRGWQVTNVERRIADMTGLMTAVEGGRAGDQSYLAWLTRNRGAAKLFADITPNYATLPDEVLSRMVNLSSATRVIFLIRDPLDRLWSHIRMQARRQRQSHEVYEKKANNILYRILNRGQETHILERGDYPGIIRKLRRVVPENRLLILFTENMMRQEGLSQLCSFLDIEAITPANTQPVHQGPEVVMLDKLRPRALKLLNEHYDWAARNVGPLPQNWQDNRARITA